MILTRDEKVALYLDMLKYGKMWAAIRSSSNVWAMEQIDEALRLHLWETICKFPDLDKLSMRKLLKLNTRWCITDCLRKIYYNGKRGYKPVINVEWLEDTNNTLSTVACAEFLDTLDEWRRSFICSLMEGQKLKDVCKDRGITASHGIYRKKYIKRYYKQLQEGNSKVPWIKEII